MQEPEPNRLAQHQFEIGKLCNVWADMEQQARSLLASVSKMPANNVSSAICSCFDFRDVLKGIKVASAAYSDTIFWVDEVVVSINYIDNELRSERNRIVHDQWSYSEQYKQIIRTNCQPRLYRPQSHMHQHLQVATLVGHTDVDIAGVTREISLEIGHLQALQGCANLALDVQKEWVSRRPQRRLPRRPEEKLGQAGINILTQQRPPEAQ